MVQPVKDLALSPSVQVRFLAWELPHAVGTAKKKTKPFASKKVILLNPSSSTMRTGPFFTGHLLYGSEENPLQRYCEKAH